MWGGGKLPSRAGSDGFWPSSYVFDRELAGCCVERSQDAAEERRGIDRGEWGHAAQQSGWRVSVKLRPGRRAHRTRASGGVGAACVLEAAKMAAAAVPDSPTKTRSARQSGRICRMLGDSRAHPGFRGGCLGSLNVTEEDRGWIEQGDALEWPTSTANLRRSDPQQVAFEGHQHFLSKARAWRATVRFPRVPCQRGGGFVKCCCLAPRFGNFVALDGGLLVGSSYPPRLPSNTEPIVKLSHTEHRAPPCPLSCACLTALVVCCIQHDSARKASAARFRVTVSNMPLVRGCLFPVPVHLGLGLSARSLSKLSREKAIAKIQVCASMPPYDLRLSQPASPKQPSRTKGISAR